MCLRRLPPPVHIYATQYLLSLHVMAGLQLPVGCPVHSFGPSAGRVENACLPACLPAQPGAQLVCFPSCAILRAFPLALVGQLPAMATREYRTAVQHCHTPPTAYYRAKPPCPLPAIVASRPIQAHGVVHRLPLAAKISVRVSQRHAVAGHLKVEVRLKDGLKPAWIGDLTFQNLVSFPRLFPRFAFATPSFGLF